MNWITGILLVLVVAGWVWVVGWTLHFRKVLGARLDWKRRFESMRKALKI